MSLLLGVVVLLHTPGQSARGAANDNRIEVLMPGVAKFDEVIHITLTTDWAHEGSSLHTTGLKLEQAWWDHCSAASSISCIKRTNYTCRTGYFDHGCAYGGGEWNLWYRGPPHFYYQVTGCETASVYVTYLGPSHEGPFGTVTNILEVLDAPPIAAFEVAEDHPVTPGVVCLGEEVQFQDQTTCGRPTGWFWDFGDGSVNITQNPVHTFRETGPHRVILKVWSSGGTSTATNTVTVSDDCVAVVGTVRDRESHLPIAGATVHLLGKTATSDANGNYRLVTSGNGVYEMWTSHPHYRNAIDTVGIFPNWPGGTVYKEVNLSYSSASPRDPDTELGPNEKSTADPVHPGTGNFAFWKTLFMFPGRELPVFFRVFYNSLAHERDGPLGPGWSHSCQISLATNAGTIKLTLGEGRAVCFWETEPGSFVATNCLTFIQLKPLAPGRLQAWLHDGTQYRFDAQGRLQEMVSVNSNKVSFSYAGELYRIQDTSGREFHFSYLSGRLRSITTPLKEGATVSFDYDQAGNLTLIRDARGNDWRFTYDAAQRMTSRLSANGLTVVSNCYDLADRIIAQTDALGGLTTFDYQTNALGIRVRIQPPGQDPVWHQYDAACNLLAMVTDQGQTLGGYAPTGLRESWTDRRGNRRTFQYDAAGNLTNWTDRAGQQHQVRVNARNRPDTVQNPTGGNVTFAYDGRGNLTQVTDARARAVSIQPNADGRPELLTDRNGNAWSWQFNAQGLPRSKWDPLGNMTAYEYDPAGRLTRLTLPNLDSSWRMAYDENGNLLSLVDALGHATSNRYDANNSLVESIRVAQSATNHYEYDALDRLVASTDAAGATLRIGYDRVGNLVSLTDADGIVVHYDHDGQNRLVARRNALGHATHYAHDANGNITSVTDPVGARWTMAYDGEDRLLEETNPAGHTHRLVYDASGRVTASINELNQVATRHWDRAGRLVGVQLRDGSLKRYVYDRNDNLLQFLDPLDGTWTFERDELNRVKTVINPLGHREQNEYDPLGRLVQKSRRGGEVLAYAHDLNGRLVQIGLPSGETIDLARDPRGAITQVEQAGQRIQMAYDQVGRRLSFRNPDGLAMQYQYTPAGRLAELTYPENHTVTRSYDAAGRLARVRDWAARVTTFQYDAADRLTRVELPNGTVKQYAYDRVGRLASLLHAQTNGVVLCRFDYRRNPAGLITNVTRRGTLDVPPMVSTRFQFLYGPGNQLLLTVPVAGSWASRFDLNGAMTYRESEVATNQYTYDAFSRLTEVQSAGHVTRYGYDPLGNRIRVDYDGVEVRFLNDTGRVYCDYQPEGPVQQFHVYGHALLYSVTAAGELRVYHEDERGSVVAISDGTGAVIQRYRYSPHGQLLVSAGSLPNRFGYAGVHGVEQDANGLLYMRARYYAPEVKRFLTEDPLAILAGANVYEYAAGDPVNQLDPNGLEERPEYTRQTYEDGLPVRFVDPTLDYAEERQINQDLETAYQAVASEGRHLVWANYGVRGFAKAWTDPGHLGFEYLDDLQARITGHEITDDAWWNRDCVVASEDRGKILANHMPNYWGVETRSYDVLPGEGRFSPHTFTMLKFTDSHGHDHYFHVDNYLGPILIEEQRLPGKLSTQNQSYQNTLIREAAGPMEIGFDGYQQVISPD